MFIRQWIWQVWAIFSLLTLAFPPTRIISNNIDLGLEQFRRFRKVFYELNLKIVHPMIIMVIYFWCDYRVHLIRVLTERSKTKRRYLRCKAPFLECFMNFYSEMFGVKRIGKYPVHEKFLTFRVFVHNDYYAILIANMGGVPVSDKYVLLRLNAKSPLCYGRDDCDEFISSSWA